MPLTHDGKDVPRQGNGRAYVSGYHHGQMRRASRINVIPVKLVPRVMLFASVAGVLLAGFPGGADSASHSQPLRDHGRGHWFEHACNAARPGAVACNAEMVSNSAGMPLPSSTPPAGASGPVQFHTGYNLPTTAATPKTIAIVDAYDDPNIASDLAAFNTSYSLPQLNTYTNSSTPGPWFRKVNQSGGTSYPPPNSGWGLEIALDVETAHEICQNCNILLVEATSNSFANLGTAENEAVALGANVVSNSWGGGESSNPPEVSSYDPYFNHPGVVITASTGDSGYGVEYPAASQYVVGVGGTTLHLNANNTYASESAWVDGGSGCSKYEPKPSWQKDTGCSHHTVADVSADADPNTGAAVYDTYGYSGWYQVGGTSLSSPLIAAVFALSGNTSSPSAPYANAGQLHDVTSGSNGSCSGSYLCTAGPGYDGPTGLGTPNGLGAFATTPPGPNYSLSATPSSRTVAPGNGTSYTVMMTPSNGYGGTVSLTGVAGTPSGASADLTQCQNLASSTPSCTVNVSTSVSTSHGTSTLTFTGSDGTLIHTATATLVVQAPDFSLSISPTSQTLRTPGSAKYTITITDLGGFNHPVNFSVSGLPSALKSSFSSSSQTSATLTISASTRQLRHSYTFTVSGTGATPGDPTHTVTASLSLQ